MHLGKQFHSEGVSNESVEQSQEKASQSALEMIASADPNGPPLPAGVNPAALAALMAGKSITSPASSDGSQNATVRISVSKSESGVTQDTTALNSSG